MYSHNVSILGGGLDCGYPVVSVDKLLCLIIMYRVLVEISPFLVFLKHGLRLNCYFNFLTLLFIDDFNHVIDQFMN